MKVIGEENHGPMTLREGLAHAEMEHLRATIATQAAQIEALTVAARKLALAASNSNCDGKAVDEMLSTLSNTGKK